LRGERRWREIGQPTVRTLVIVMLPELRQLLPGVLQRRKPLCVQTLVPQPAIEALDEPVLDRPAWPDETQLHVVSHGPRFERSA